MWFWVVAAIVVAGVLLYGAYLVIKGTPEKPKPAHNYEVLKRTYNDGSEKFLASYLVDWKDIDGDWQFHYIGTETLSRFKPTLYDTKDEAVAACEKHWGDKQKGTEVIVEKLVIGQ